MNKVHNEDLFEYFSLRFVVPLQFRSAEKLLLVFYRVCNTKEIPTIIFPEIENKLFIKTCTVLKNSEFTKLKYGPKEFF